MAVKKQGPAFGLPEACVLQSLTEADSAKHTPLVRKYDGVAAQYWHDGGRVRCCEFQVDEPTGVRTSETEELLAAEAEFGRLLPKLKAELAGGGVPDPVPSRHRSARDCSAAGRRC